MNNHQQLKYVKHNDIETGKWARCVEEASNSRVYANIWHLDRAAEVWDALIFGNYEYVMPLPYRMKWGIPYIYQPLYCQQLGIFPSPPLEIAGLFYKMLYKKFLFLDVQLNASNLKLKEKFEIDFLPRDNYLLTLDQDYKTLSKKYSKNAKRNLTKAKTNQLNIITGIRLEEYLAFKSENMPTKVHKKELEKLKSIIAYGQYKGFGEIYGVFSSSNKLCAAVYFCWWKDRVTYLNAATNSSGKELGAMYFLIDEFIKQHANRNLKIDFEGSAIPGVARFYRGFGAVPETYFRLKINRLPLPLKWLKRT